MYFEKIFKKEKIGFVKAKVKLRTNLPHEIYPVYEIAIFTKAMGESEWQWQELCINSFWRRNLNYFQKKEVSQEEILKFLTKEEVEEICLLCWQKVKPNILMVNGDF